MLIMIVIIACTSVCSISLLGAPSSTKVIGTPASTKAIGHGVGNIMRHFQFEDGEKTITQNIFNKGSIRNAADAARIAKVIFCSIYGDDFNHGLPLIAEFNDAAQVWSFKTQLPKGVEGSTKQLSIRTRNAEVVAITDGDKNVTENIFNTGCIRNATDAADVARILFQTIYGDNFDCGMPLIVAFDDAEQVWLIQTQVPKWTDGGGKYLIIKKSNAEIVGIWGTL